MERFVFDVERFPVIPSEELLTELDRKNEARMVDVEEELRATLRKLSYSAGKLADLPEGCTWTVAMEIKDDADAPIGHPQHWEPAQTKSLVSQNGKGKGKGEEMEHSGSGSGSGSCRIGRNRGGTKSTAVRAVEVGEFVMEAWIEEGRAKFSGGEEERS